MKKVLIIVLFVIMPHTSFSMKEVGEVLQEYQLTLGLAGGAFGAISAEQTWNNGRISYALYKNWSYDNRIENKDLSPEQRIEQKALEFFQDPEIGTASLLCDIEKSTPGILCIKYAGKAIVWLAATGGIGYLVYSII